MTHVEELFDKYCSKHTTCDTCKYHKDKRVTDTKMCNEVYAEDYYKRWSVKMLEVKESKDTCISCCDKKKLSKQVRINRNGSSFKGANIVTISLCDDCLKKLATEFQLHC